MSRFSESSIDILLYSIIYHSSVFLKLNGSRVKGRGCGCVEPLKHNPRNRACDQPSTTSSPPG